MTSLARHARRNAIAYVALFLTLSMGTAWALGNNSVKSKHIANGQVKNQDLARNSVRSKNVVDGQVKNQDLARNSVRSKNIVDGQVKPADLADLIPRKAQLVAISSPSTSADKSVDAECPPGKVAITGGATIEGGDGAVALTRTQPVNPPSTPYTGWRASAIEVNGGTAEEWTLTAFANCFELD